MPDVDTEPRGPLGALLGSGELEAALLALLALGGGAPVDDLTDYQLTVLGKLSALGEQEYGLKVVEALPVTVNADGEAECPHCKAVGWFANIDQATRVNPGEVTVQDRVMVAYWGEGDTNFDTIGYKCTSCDMPVVMPDDLIEQHG
jgi:hypothetical protein